MKNYMHHYLVISMLLLAMILVPTGVALGQTGTEIGFFDEVKIAPESQVEVPIQIKRVQNLFALDVSFSFDPKVVTAEDADPNTPGIQMALGKFLDPGLVLTNSIDNTSGTGRFVMTQYNPSKPKSGDGILLVVFFKGVKAGETELKMDFVQLANGDSQEISVVKVNSTLQVSASAPPIVATSIPVHPPTQMVPIPTIILPTETPVYTPTVAATAGSTATVKVATATSAPEVEDEAAAEEGGKSALSPMWWIVIAVVVLVAIGGVVYKIAVKKPYDEV